MKEKLEELSNSLDLLESSLSEIVEFNIWGDKLMENEEIKENSGATEQADNY